MDYELLGKNIRKFRLQAGIKQEELAEQVDCTGSHIGQIERGRRVPSLEMVVRIANALHVTVDQLLLDYTEYPELVYLRDAEKRVQGFSTQGKVLACEMIDGLLGLIEGLKP